MVLDLRPNRKKPNRWLKILDRTEKNRTDKTLDRMALVITEFHCYTNNNNEQSCLILRSIIGNNHDNDLGNYHDSNNNYNEKSYIL